MENKEIWKDIPGFENLYLASNFGNIKSYPKTIKYADGRIYNYQEKILKPSANNVGYLHVNLFKSRGNPISKDIHRIIAKIFIPNLQNKSEVNHKNGIKSDNRSKNLEWVTSSENKKHGFKNGLYSYEKLRQSGLKGNQKIKEKMEAKNGSKKWKQKAKLIIT